MLMLAGPSGALGHDGGKFHPEQPGRISPRWMDCATSISTVRSTMSPRPRRNWTTRHGCTQGNTSTNLTASALGLAFGECQP